MSRNPLICIIGPDGAGKSTQADLLMEVLSKEDGIKPIYRWLRFTHLFTLPLLAIARLLGYSEVEDLESGRSIGYHHFNRSLILQHLYPILLFIDTLIAYIFKILVPRLVIGRTIVCDRFIHDTVISISISTGRMDFLTSFLGRVFISMIPDDAIVIVMNANESVLRERRDDVMADSTICTQIELYRRMAEELNLHQIDAGDSPIQIHEQICQILSESDGFNS